MLMYIQLVKVPRTVSWWKEAVTSMSAEMSSQWQWKKNNPEKNNVGSWTRGWMKSPEKNTTRSAVMCATPLNWSDPFRNSKITQYSPRSKFILFSEWENICYNYSFYNKPNYSTLSEERRPGSVWWRKYTLCKL